jgi:ribosomally synthesized peptide
VTQDSVERTLGKLLTDEAFRERFFAAPAEACREAGLSLSSGELEALQRLSREALVRFGEDVDARISRPCLDRTGRGRDR